MKLSICIPTYNRKKFLKELIESIICQIKNEKEVEICISDNNSTDGTKEMIENYKKNGVNIIYHKNLKNIGPDLNYLKCVEIATGNYCWLMGSDDVLKQGSITKILKEISRNSDISIFLGNRIECNYKMETLKKRYWLNPKKINKDLVINFSNKSEVINYLNNSLTLGAVFSYLSSIIVKKNEWDSIKYDDSYTGTSYSHVYMILSILKKNNKMKYLYEDIIFCRGENDSFLNNNDFKKRAFIDYNGYLKLSSLLSNTDERTSFLKILRKEHGIKSFIRQTLNSSKFSIEEKNILKKIGYSKFMVDYLLNFIYYNKTFFKILYWSYQKLK